MSVMYIRNAETGEFEPVVSLQGPPGEGILPPLVGTTDEVTPTQVYEAIQAGRDVRITATYNDTGERLTFTGFVVIPGNYPQIWASITDGASKQDEKGLRHFVLRGYSAADQWLLIDTQVATPFIRLANPEKLTFTGAANGTYDGSAAKTVNIPTVPEKLPNPNKLTIKDSSGSTLATYDGSQGVTLELPESSGGAGELIAPIIVSTSDSKPSEVAPYIQQGAKIWIQHVDANYGILIFTSYVIQSTNGSSFTLVCSAVFNLSGVPMLGQLVGGAMTDDTWQFSITPLAVAT